MIRGKELTLRDLQTYSLKIIQNVDKWCVANGVNYTLCGGSLIGAIRHKGFIPWDDDVDIAMPRPDYEKFVSGFNHEGLICIAPELGNSLIPFARVCETKETLAVPYCPWCTIKDFGVGIDIFPWDGEPDDIHEFKQHMGKIRNQNALLYQVRGSRLPLTLNLGFVRICKNVGKKILYGNKDLETLLANLVTDIQKYRFGETNYCGNFSCPTYGEKERSRTEVFSSFTRIPFEDCELSVISNYDEYLRDIFGDYMQLPPINARVPKHGDHKFYFK